MKVVYVMRARTSLFDWKLDNPIIISSGPFSKDANSILQLFEFGAGAVVTKTISNIKCKNKGIVRYKDHIFNRDGYSTKSIDDWDTYFEKLRNKHVIASICADSPQETAKLAQFAVSRGVEVIELGISCPTFNGEPICFNASLAEEYCREVRKAVSVPILVKLLISTSKEFNIKLVSELKEIGIDGVSVSDSIPGLLIDSLNNEAILGGAGGISGPILKPLVLKTIYDIRDIGLPVIGIGGVESSDDILDYIRVGSTAVQICSILFKKKISYIGELNKSLDNYLIKNNLMLDNVRRSIL